MNARFSHHCGSLAVAVVVALIVAAACGDDDEPSSADSTSTSTSTSASTSPSATTATTGGATTTPTTLPPETGPSTAPSPTTPATPTGDAGAATAEITDAFTVFFDGLNLDVDAKVARLEDGERFRTMLEDATADPQAQQLSVRVESVTLLSDDACPTRGVAAPCAEVVHDLIVGTLPALVGNVGLAVATDDTWRVSARTWCELVVIGGAECPG